MVGYIGGRAKRRKRNFYIYIILILVFGLGIYIFPSFKIDESVPSNSLLPNEEDKIVFQTNSRIEELELRTIDQEQKIIFRNKTINDLKTKLKIFNEENDKLKLSIVNLNEQINVTSNDVQLIDQIKKEKNTEIKKLFTIIANLKNEKKDFILEIKKINDKNELLKKEYKNNMSKNLKLNNLQKKLENQIKKLENQVKELENILKSQKKIIEEQNLLIKVLKDNSPHG